jgi:hypothetical protein
VFWQLTRPILRMVFFQYGSRPNGGCFFEMPEHELTRRAMYDLVWSWPMIRVAEDLGLSDVALKRFVTSIGSHAPARVLRDWQR